VLVVGLARQGIALARFLTKAGAQVTITDVKPAAALGDAVESLAGLPIALALGGHPFSLLDGTDLLCLSGGVAPDIPLAAEARRRGIRFSNDALLTLRRRPERMIGVTGSSGKTTTTTLVGLMLREDGQTAHVGGNIGTPLIDHLDELGDTDWTVMELSSFQLELFDCSPPVAAVTNVTPNHLDRHGTMAAYSEAKANILRWQRAEDVCVLGADDEIAGRWLRSGWVDIPAAEGTLPWEKGARKGWRSYPLQARRLGFSLCTELEAGAFLSDEELVLRLPDQPDVVICRREAIRLRGIHNVGNLLAALCLAGAAGVSPSAMARVATTFAGVEHRLEPIRTLRGVLWVNDSIATSPERAVAAMESFEEPIVLLAGGRDKRLSWNEFAETVRSRVKHLVLFGEAAGSIERAVKGQGTEAAPGTPAQRPAPPLTHCTGLEEAVAVAQGIAEPGDVVLLAPGGTSFDAYKDFVARGEHYRTLVNDLEE
jgi:UDP-N-acetylmuramoylalanine--D-glutamate ligase